MICFCFLLLSFYAYIVLPLHLKYICIMYKYMYELRPGEMCAPLVIAAKNALSIGDAIAKRILGYVRFI